MNSNLVSYYQQRAAEYDEVYHKPERKNDLQTMATILQNIFCGKMLFEIGCGTGYWTERIAKTADMIIATDVNESVLDIARERNYHHTPVVFRELDFYYYNDPGQYESIFGGFIWSHIPVQDLQNFIQKINSYVSPGGTVVFIDNNYVHGSNTPISEIDLHGNTYQFRTLKDGSTHKVRKNFPGSAFLKQQLRGIADNIEIIQLSYFWVLKYTVRH